MESRAPLSLYLSSVKKEWKEYKNAVYVCGNEATGNE